MAGPWFTVHSQVDTWKKLETIWISNGRFHEQADVELRTQLSPPPAAQASLR